MIDLAQLLELDAALDAAYDDCDRGRRRWLRALKWWRRHG